MRDPWIGYGKLKIVSDILPFTLRLFGAAQGAMPHRTEACRHNLFALYAFWPKNITWNLELNYV